MTKLKTLKDINEGIRSGSSILFEKELKAEAIKWANRYNKQNFKDNKTKVSADTLRWIKHFFNLTKDDLK